MKFVITSYDAQERHEQQSDRALTSLNRARRRIDLLPLAHAEVAWSYDAVPRYHYDTEEYLVDLRLVCCHETNMGSASLGDKLPIDIVPETLSFFEIRHVVSPDDYENFGTFVPPGLLDYKAIVIDGFRTKDMSSHILVCRWDGEKVRRDNQPSTRLFQTESRMWHHYMRRTTEKLLAGITKVDRGSEFQINGQAMIRLHEEKLRRLVALMQPGEPEDDPDDHPEDNLWP